MENLRRRRRALGSALSISIIAATVALVLTFAGGGSAASTAGPTNNTPPSVSPSSPKDGDQLTVDDGSWTGSGSIQFANQWKRCDTTGATCSTVGSNSTHYTVVSADVGMKLKVKVTATDSVDSTSVDTALTSTVQAKKPSNTSKPTVSGTAQDNQILTADPGQWSGSTPFTYKYQWQDCDTNGANCVDNGGTDKTYHVASGDIGKKLRVKVTATNDAGSDFQYSDPTAVVTSSSGANQAPVNTSLPSISGTAQDGQTFTASQGSWNPSSGNNFSYQWQRCDTNGNNCSIISGATSSTYRNTSSDVGHRLRVAVTATNTLGHNTSTSAATNVVASASTTTTTTTTTTPTTTAPNPGKVIPVTQVVSPNRLIVSSTRWTPKAIGATGQQLTGRIRIIDSTGTSVSGALVYAAGIPYNRISAAPETFTDASGWATITFVTLKGMPIKKGALLQVFIRVRKQGDDILGGVSSRRLVSVRVVPQT